MKRKTDSHFANFISSIAIFVIAILVISFFAFKTDGFKNELIPFYVKCGNNTFVKKVSTFDIVLNEPYKFEIISSIDIEEETNFSVSIVPNATENNDFSFKVDGVEHSFSELKSLSYGFIFKQYENYFILRSILDLPEIIKSYFPNSSITDVPSAVDSGVYYFKLSISIKDTSEEINIYFNLLSERGSL